MELFVMILAGLVLAYAAGKRADAARKALLDYVCDLDKGNREAIAKLTETDEKMAASMEAVQQKLLEYGQDFSALSGRVSSLEQGACPDFNKAMAAKEAVDNFSAGLMGILTYGEQAPQKTQNQEDNAGWHKR